MKKKKLLLILLILGLLVITLILFMFFKSRDNLKSESPTDDILEFDIVGKWYSIYDMTNYEYKFKKDGTYVITELRDDGHDPINGTYVLNKDDKTLVLYKKTKYYDRVEDKEKNFEIIEANSEYFLIHIDIGDNYYLFYRNYEDRKPYEKDCFNSDENGFCIKDKVLLSYIGNEKEVTIPSDVRVVGSNSFAGDFNRGINTDKVIIPGTVKEIQGAAFAFSFVDEVVIEEGVKTIGDYLFMDNCISSIDFPKSIKEVGKSMFTSEEYCPNALKIYLYKDSVMDDYFKKYEPDYYDYEIIYK